MDGSFRIGSLFGIPIQIHYTFLLVIPLFAWIIGSQISLTVGMLQEIYAVPIDTALITSGFMPYILGAIVSCGLFFGVLVHELAHSLVARTKGIAINSITLMIFGGVATMEEGIPDPKVELPMALVGPIASLIFGLFCGGLVYFVPSLVPDPGSCRCPHLPVRLPRRPQHHPLLLQPDPGISHGRRPGAPGMACKTDAAPPGHPDRGRYRQGLCHHLRDHRALSSSPRS